MNILQAAILGLVQGLTEFLPVSSSGHLILARSLMGISSESGAYVLLDVLLHVGTLLAILVVFWKDWINMLRHPVKDKTLRLLIIASIPAVAAVLLFNDFVDSFFTGWFLGFSFLITAVFLTVAELVSTHARKWDSKPGLKHAIVMGLMQAVALLPGVSRSGSTLTGGLCSKLKRDETAKFAFMMSAPIIFGSLLFEGKDALEQNLLPELALVPTLVGIAVAAVSGYLAIRLMLQVIRKSSLLWFALYVALLGFAVLILQMCGSALVPAFVIPAL